MDNVLVITFAEDANAYEALTKLKELDGQDRLELAGAAVAMRNEDGSVDIKDEVGDIGYAGTATGGIVGLVIGVLGGPLGVLLGGATGVLVGSLFDLDDVDDADSVLTDMARSIRVDHESVVAEISEPTPEIVDAAVGRLGGTIVRRPVADVEAEIAAAEDAQQAARKEARRELREQRRKERTEKVQAKIAELKSKLHNNRPVAADRS